MKHQPSATTARVALLWRGDLTQVEKPTPQNNRLYPLFRAFTDLKVAAEAVLYSDQTAQQLRDRLISFDGVLVWVDPITNGSDRSKLDPMLNDLSDHGVLISAHPDVIQKIGTKEVLFHTKHFGWGTDTRLYADAQELKIRFPDCLKSTGPRVLKQRRGNAGIGTWKVQAIDSSWRSGPIVRVQEARRGNLAEELPLSDFMHRCARYFSDGGCLIDQPLQERTDEGMIRCYLVHRQVVGFSTQMPRSAGDFAMAREKAMYDSSEGRFHLLKTKMESEWIPALERLFSIETSSLPVIWDADFFYGPKNDEGQDTYVLGEINVSAVLPFPGNAVETIAEATLTRLLAAKQARHPKPRRVGRSG